MAGTFSREVRNVVFKNVNATTQFDVEPSPAADSLTMLIRGGGKWRCLVFNDIGTCCQGTGIKYIFRYILNE